MKYHYKADLNELATLAANIESFSKSQNINSDIHYALNLCLDEIFTNIVSHGMKNTPDKQAFIELELNNHHTHIEAIIRDNGPQYDPINQKNLNPTHINSSVEERPVGGLGVYFLDQYMDKVTYNFENNLNTLSLQKNL